jgi:homoserine dehydrogenase
MRSFNLCFLGFGNVNRALVRLLASREEELRSRYAIEFRITGIASRRIGWIADPKGLPTHAILPTDETQQWAYRAGTGSSSTPPRDVRSWLEAAQADVLFEATSLNAHTGQPAIDHLQAALERGAHAITANKGPVVHAYEELTALAKQQGRRFLFESTVMDGVPIFALFRDTLPLVHLQGFRGVLNSTTNVILGGMEQGLSFEDSLRRAQELGVAETDASDDIDGWDAAVKVAALARVLMNCKLDVSEIQRTGIRSLSGEAVRSARAEGRPYKLVCRARKTGDKIHASVAPEQVHLGDPLALVEGTSSAVYFETDIFPGLAILENDPGLDATAYGMMADFLRAVAE